MKSSKAPKIAQISLTMILLLLGSAFSRPAPATAADPPPERVITIAAVGDIMMGSDFPCQADLPPQDGRQLFKPVQAILSRADISFGNLEGPLCDGGDTTKDVDSGNVFVFRTPTRFAVNLQEAGLKVVSLANNHDLDFGRGGLASTRQALDRVGVKHAGQEGEVAEFEVAGVKIALIALTFGPGPRSINHPRAALAEIAALAKKYQILLVSIHTGAEGRGAQHVANETECFLGEDRGNSVKFAHDAVDRGAALILCHGPHVPRAVEIYHDRLIAYSLGNFCTYKGMNLTGACGLAPILWVELNGQGEFLRGQIHSYLQDRPGGPQPDAQARAYERIEALSLADFPESCPLFTGAGAISPLAVEAKQIQVPDEK
jgi:poly-gamma-glutamate capsule biosynthesis protein CapA/YwtB (metallophosphatase superfamily)